MPDPHPSPNRPEPAVLFEAPGGDVLAARTTARTLLTPPPPQDIAGLATLLVTAALLQAGLNADDRVTAPRFHAALLALLRKPRLALQQGFPVFVAYAAAERIDFPAPQSRRLSAWLQDHFGIRKRHRDPVQWASELKTTPKRVRRLARSRRSRPLTGGRLGRGDTLDR